MSGKHFEYPWSEWNEALEHFLSAMENPHARQNAYLTTEAYFPQRYHDSEEAEWKRLRFEKAMKWLDENMDEFDYGRVGVIGKEEGLIAKEVYWAIHHFFSEIGDHLLEEDPPDGLVKAQVEAFLNGRP